VPLSPALSHEFWIEPQKYQVDNGATLLGDFKNGELFEGINLSYLDTRSERYIVVADGIGTRITPRAGDRPALNLPAPLNDGLVIVAHETTPQVVTYNDWDKFLSFVAHKDFANVPETQAANGWPTDDPFRERYTRHAKALIAVGNGEGQDQTIGLETEFTALTNPYAAGFDDMMKVLLTYDGAPRPDAQVEVFDRAPDGTVEVTLLRTDGVGEATVPVTPGHEYLLDAVVLREAPDAGKTEDSPLWETLWAALTFKVPQ